MCGIAGYYGQGNKEILEKMARTLRHRGPDDEGFCISANVGLGQRRLSIIDLSPAGHQPMANEDETVWIIFNGEIYNFKELGRGLKREHRFKGRSDTEIMVHLYEEIGVEMFGKIMGMFAIALYDKVKNKIYLARDRMGKKPLYYGLFNNTLIFGSELKALMPHPEFKKELDLFSLNKYLFYEYIPTPATIFKNVHKLEPGHYLEYDGRTIKKEKFWEIEFKVESRKSKVESRELISELDNRLSNAVKDRLVSDVPIGIFLSGGIDSSTIAYYAQRNSTQKIKTFSIGFKEASFDESKYARQVANFLGTDHYEKIFSVHDCLDLIPRISEMLDEPIADSSIIPTYLLSQFTKEKVTVALGGDGGDELFCGYDTFIAHQLADFYEKIPQLIRKSIIEKIALILPTSFSNISFDFKAKSFIAGFYGDKKYRDARWMSSYNSNMRENIFQADIWSVLKKKNEYEDIDRYLDHKTSTTDKREKYYQNLILLYLRMYLMEEILVKVDRASMFNSLEVRAPFLDTAVVEFANSLPISLKLHNLTTKYILKKTMEDKLPQEVVYRKKKGFGMPVAHWISGELKPFVLEVLNEEKIKTEGLFNFRYINNLLNEHFSGKRDNRKSIWTLLMFEMWMDKWNKI
jgi:asparagine synthase (glutamine-hydrolysing)